MQRYLDEYFKSLTPLEQPERGSHAVFINGQNYAHKDATIREFAERLAMIYPRYSIEITQTEKGPTQCYVEANLIRKKPSSLDSLI